MLRWLVVARHGLGRVRELGSTDCELIGDGALIHQPVNAASSLSYVVAGAWVVWWGVRHARVRSSDAWVFGAALALTSVGSLDFHGPASVAARWLHDASIAIAVLFMVAFNVGVLVEWTRSRVYGVFGALVVVAAAVLAAAPDAAVALTTVGVVALVSSEALVLRNRLRPLRERGRPTRRNAYLVLIVAFALGGIVNALSRTDAPWCDPASAVQGHGLWHALTAIAFAAWAVAALPEPVAERVGEVSQP